MSAEYDLWTDPNVCLDPGCIIDGQGDPTPESGHGAIPVDPVDGQLPFDIEGPLEPFPVPGYSHIVW